MKYFIPFAIIVILAWLAMDSGEQPVQAQNEPQAELCRCGLSCPCGKEVESIPVTKPAEAPKTKIVWAQDCSNRNSCSMVQTRVPMSDSRSEVGFSSASQPYSTQRTGLLRRIFRRR